MVVPQSDKLIEQGQTDCHSHIRLTVAMKAARQVPECVSRRPTRPYDKLHGLPWRLKDHHVPEDIMGILDGLIGLMSGGPQQGQSPLAQMALQVIQQNGGLPGLIGKFQQAGLGQQVGSWVGTGQNLPISAEQLQQVLGSGQIAQIAQQLGLSHGETGNGLAQALPQIIDKLTPAGQISADHSDMLKQALAALTSRSA
jgi:uncharacterized protein YidB (DUF937 family)